MSKNKFPEETEKRILEVSLELFAKKGYDKTTIQDIVNALGMTKGAVYHHFKSKNDILNRLFRYNEDTQCGWLNEVMNDESLNGIQKLRKIFVNSMTITEKIEMDLAFSSLLKDPKFVVENLKITLFETASGIASILEIGKKDGSIKVNDPIHAAQVLMLCCNFWLNPGIFPGDDKELFSRVLFLKEVTDLLGIPLVDADFILIVTDFYSKINR